MLALIVFIAILGFLVFVHELGHFVMARRNGIAAGEFGFGFPPRVLGIYRAKKNGKWRLVWGGKEVEAQGTVYSLNLLPIGGFVRIKGEGGEHKGEKDSFASKSAWVRSRVLLAGVVMNFVAAWLFFSVAFMLGTPEEVEGNAPGAEILISAVNKGSSAERIGVKVGDVIAPKQESAEGNVVKIESVEDLQQYVGARPQQEIALAVVRGDEKVLLKGVTDKTGEGRGVLGVSLAQVVTRKYGPVAALGKGLGELGSSFVMIADVFKRLLGGQREGLDVTGVVGIAVYTGQVVPLGMAYLLRFAAILSVNLGVINALPFPALDGGRVLFILIEKLKGSAVSVRVEQSLHTIGFFLLIILMLFVTWRDFIRFDIFGRIWGLFS